jgi:hypothetical protein
MYRLTKKVVDSREKVLDFSTTAVFAKLAEHFLTYYAKVRKISFTFLKIIDNRHHL